MSCWYNIPTRYCINRAVCTIFILADFRSQYRNHIEMSANCFTIEHGSYWVGIFFLPFFSRFVQVKMAFLQVCEYGNSINFHKYFDISAILYSTLPLKCTNIVQVLSWNLQYSTRCACMQRNTFERKNTISWSEAGQLQMGQSPAVYCLMFGFCLQCTSGMVIVILCRFRSPASNQSSFQ